MKQNERISVIKFNSLFLNENVWGKSYKMIKEKICIQNAAYFYQLAKHFNSRTIQKAMFSYIERCFTIVVETKHFSELDYTSVSRILGSSNLLIDSEVQVYDAANAWLSYNILERSKFAKNILFKARLHLLSDNALRCVLNRRSFLAKVVLSNIGNLYQNKSSTYYTSRYCNQKLFSTLICGGLGLEPFKPVKSVKEFDLTNYRTDNSLPPMIEERYRSKTVCLKGEIYVFGGYDDNGAWTLSVEKYSSVTRTWNKVADMFDERGGFCACGFVDKVFIIGGRSDSVLQFDAKDYGWKEVARMEESRTFAACAVFEDTLVVSGGLDNNPVILNTVESYDVVTDSWTPMPDMIERRRSHNLVAVKSKLFVIGSVNRNKPSEVFDSTCKKFVALQSPKFSSFNNALSVESKIYVFQNDESSIFVYDVDKDEWSEEVSVATKNIRWYCCVKLPIY